MIQKSEDKLYCQVCGYVGYEFKILPATTPKTSPWYCVECGANRFIK